MREPGKLVTAKPMSSIKALRNLEKQYCAKVAELDALTALLPGVTYMDPPDGGSVTLVEQFARMAKDAERYRWLRYGDNDEHVLMHGPVDPNYVYLPRNEKLDAMVDSFNAIGKTAGCQLPPKGWKCTRQPGHGGPCAAVVDEVK